MVEIKEVFSPNKNIKERDKLFKAVKELSDKIGESSGTSTFITTEDAINSNSKIFLIKKEIISLLPVERNFIAM